jgi:hypothetical protein
MHSMVMRASEPRRSANSSCAEPKISRKSLERNLPSLRAADAVMVFIDILRPGQPPPAMPCRLNSHGRPLPDVLQHGIERYACHGRSQELSGGIPTSKPWSPESAEGGSVLIVRRSSACGFIAAWCWSQRLLWGQSWHKFHAPARVTMFLFRSRLIAIQSDTPHQRQITEMSP